MNTLDAIKTRRAVRNWTDKDIPEDILVQILEPEFLKPPFLHPNPAKHFQKFSVPFV